MVLVLCDTNTGIEEIDIDPVEVARHRAFAAAKRNKKAPNGRKKKGATEVAVNGDRRKPGELRVSQGTGRELPSYNAKIFSRQSTGVLLI